MKVWILAFILLATSFQAAQIKSTLQLSQGVGFGNNTDNYDDEFISTFTNFINSASAFYKNDTQKRLDYISDKLNQKYSRQLKFSIFQENDT